MSLNVIGGAALPVATVSDGRPTISYNAIPVHTFSGIPSDGRGVTAVPVAQPVVYLAASDLDTGGGKYHLIAMPDAMPVASGILSNVSAGPAIAVYEA